MAAGCPLCGSISSTPHLEKSAFSLVRCVDCGLIYVSPMPDTAALRAHYDDPAYFAGQADQGYRDYADMHRALHPHFNRRLDRLDRLRPERGRLLDVGCADGYFLKLAQWRGWQVAGVELSAPMAERAAQSLAAPVVNRLQVLSDETFQAITLWEVIEHLPDPVQELRRLHQRLRPGGVLMLSTPNTGHWQAESDPGQWIAYRPPSHLIYFTEQTLRAALARAGFGEIHIEGVMPLPRLPRWLDRLTRPLQQSLAGGSASAWPLALWAWRAVRLFGMASSRLRRSRDDNYVTLEAVARPA